MQSPRVLSGRRFTRDDLSLLADIESGTCVSLYMPTELATATADEPRIRFKNLLRRAEKKIEGLEDGKALQPMIEEGRRLMANPEFWRRRSEGLAVFFTADRFHYLWLPVRFEESVTVGNRFRIKPLIPLFMADFRFYVLALSQSAIRLLDCTLHSVSEIEPETVSGGLARTLAYDTKQASLQHHAADVVGGGARPAMFHGHGVSIDDHKDEIKRFFLEVDKALAGIVTEPEVPLVLAGVDYLIPIFREVTSYKWVLPDALTGNPDASKAEELHARALDIVRPELEQRQRKAEARYRDLAGKGVTAAGIREVVPAAAGGRVDTLFVSLDDHRPGIFDPATHRVTLTDGAPEAEDLLDRATVETLRNSGVVYALAGDRMPEKDAAAAAILRY